MLNAVSVYDDRKSDIDTFVYPDSHMPEEHLFIPAPNSQPETQGWVVGTAVNYKKQRTELSVFDIRGVSDGPIYTAELPYMLPLGLHGKFVQSF
jgi:carotenoid cleavage dioxygenase